MNTDLTSDFRYVVKRHGFPPIRVAYSRVEQIMREFEEYSRYWIRLVFFPEWSSRVPSPALRANSGLSQTELLR